MPKTKRPLAVQRQITQIARDVREARLLQRLPQRVVASRAGISIQTLAEFERGEANPSLDVVLRILRALGYADAVVEAFDYRKTPLGQFLIGQEIPQRAR